MEDKKMGCPRCSGIIGKKYMRKINHASGAVLDVCDKCGGMWLDGPEVKSLYGFSQKNQNLKKQR